MTDNTIKIIPLGGVEEIGINCTAFEYGSDIIVIDAGLGFPLSDQYGVDYVIPNIDYLKKNVDRIKGLVITHAHLDHIGALPFILKELNFPPIHASEFAIAVIKNKLVEYDLLNDTRFVEIKPESEIVLGSFRLEFFRVNHSIPQSMGVVVRTPAGTIVHTGDFKFDNSPVNEQVADYAKIAATGSQGVLALLSDSTNSFKPGHSKSEKVIAEVLEGIVEDAKGRVVVATFSSLVTRLYQLIMIAKQTNRKVAIIGKSMDFTINTARKIGYIDAPDHLFIPSNKIHELPDQNVMILATGAQGEHVAGLARMARGEHPDISIKKGDTVILSASIIPGNDMLVQGLIDEISERGAYVFHNAEIMDLHSSGHGYQEDQKIMLNLVKPKFFMPVHGYPSFLHRHAQTAVTVGMNDKDIIIAKRGDIIEINNSGWKINGKVKAYPILVSGSGVGDIGNVVLSDREQLANYGVVVIAASIDKQTQTLKSPPQVVTRGFVFVKESKKLLQEMEELSAEVIKSELQGKHGLKEIKERLSKRMRKFLYEQTEREPMILPVISED